MSDDVMLALISKVRDLSRRADQVRAQAEPVRPPVDVNTLERAEVALGRRLPSMLRSVFLTIGDGGFGPGYGLLPLFPVGRSDDGESVTQLYRGLSSREPEDPGWIWPAH